MALPLPRSTPEAQGLSSRSVHDFVSALDRIPGLHSVMVLRHGSVVAEGWWHPYGPSLPHLLFSLSKSFTSTAIGFAVHEGLLGVDDFVTELLPDDLPSPVSENLAKLRIRHLLTMTMGTATDTTVSLRIAGHNWAKTILAHPIEFEPGTHFVYNSGATYLLSAILAKVTGVGLLDYLTPRLFEPLGILGANWQTCPRGIAVGGWGLSVTTEDVAAFGQLYLQGGRWNGEQLVPASWVEEATSFHVRNGDFEVGNDSTQGYGYQFWRSQHGAYRGDGAFGQFCIVLPEQDAVVVATAGVQVMQAVLDTVWAKLLPALDDGAPLAENTGAQTGLERDLARLAIPRPVGERTPPTADRHAGTSHTFAKNIAHLESLRLEETGADITLVIVDATGEHRIPCGVDGWLEGGEWTVDGAPRKLASAGAWGDDGSFHARLCSIETPFALDLVLAFSGDSLELTIDQNVSFGPTRILHAVGTASA